MEDIVTKKVRLGKIMFDLFDKYEDCDDILESLRSLHTEGIISESDYDYCLQHWDEILLDWESK